MSRDGVMDSAALPQSVRDGVAVGHAAVAAGRDRTRETKNPAVRRQPPDLPGFFWLREVDLNHRPSGYEPDELPGCSIPRKTVALSARTRYLAIAAGLGKAPGGANRHIFHMVADR